MSVKTIPYTCGIACVFILAACQSNQNNQIRKEVNAGKIDTVKSEKKFTANLPEPYATKSVTNYSDVIGWSGNKTPVAPQGFTVTKFADSLDNPRWIYVGPNGDIFISEANAEVGGVKKAVTEITGKAKSQNLGKSANRITILRDANNDGIPEVRQTFLTGLNQPFGMLIIGNKFYVANTDGIVVYPYQPGETQIKEPGKKILSLPAGGYNNHWTRNIITNKDSSKIYVTVGSGSNVGEHGMDNEVRRACILEINPDGSGEVTYASGLRNPQGMGWAPGTNTLWTAVNERDELGDELVPDYITSVQKGGFYGWPYAYFGQHEDPRVKDKRPDLVQKTIVPDVPVGSHTASLGLAFDEKKQMPGKYAGGAFIGQHGSWNSSKLVGYEVAFVSFKNGKPAAGMEPFLIGFIADSSNKKVYGRPVGVAFAKDGALLVADDASNTIWRVSYPSTRLRTHL
jgi:glucose/arabinose dehydrogenase